MAQLGSLQDNQKNAYLLDSHGEVAQRVIVSEGNLNVTVDASGEIVNVFNSISSVISSVQTLLVNYVVPVGKFFYLQMIEVSGTNIARYDVLKDLTLIARKRTYFGSGLNSNFSFVETNNRGLKFLSGETINVKVEHFRPSNGDFDGRIVGILSSV